MTLKEVSEFLGLSEKTISNNLKRTQDSLERRGFRLIKRGRGSKAQYEVSLLNGREKWY